MEDKEHTDCVFLTSVFSCHAPTQIWNMIGVISLILLVDDVYFFSVLLDYLFWKLYWISVFM